MRFSCFVAAVVFLGFTSQADGAGSFDCSVLVLSKVPVGTQCKTAQGFEWLLVDRESPAPTPAEVGVYQAPPRETWKDLTSGLTWYGIMGGGNQYYAFTVCTLDKKLGLPTIEEFDVAYKHGFMEVNPSYEDAYMWSSSVVLPTPEWPDSEDWAGGNYAWGWSLHYATLEGRLHKWNRALEVAFTCVGR